jgi:glutathione S-transferase
LAEKGLQVPFEELDLMKGELKTPEFIQPNPFERAPVLVLDDGAAISETIAICRWNRRRDLGLLLCVSQAFRHLHPAMARLEAPQVAAWGEVNNPGALEIQLANLDRWYREMLARPSAKP